MIKKPHSIVAVTVTPFREGVRPDLEEIARQTEELANSRAEVIFPNASTGEFPRMDKADKLAVMSVEEIASLPCMPKGREEVILGGAVWLATLMQTLGILQITISDNDNLEGYAIKRGLM